MPDVEKTIRIAAPPDRVWDVWMNVEHWADWTASITSIQRLDAGPLAVGSRVRILQPKLRPAVWSVTQLDVCRNFTWRSGIPGLNVFGSHMVEPEGQGSLVTLTVEFKGLFGRLAARAFRKLNEEYVGMEAAGLKRQCEEQI